MSDSRALIEQALLEPTDENIFQWRMAASKMEISDYTEIIGEYMTKLSSNEPTNYVLLEKRMNQKYATRRLHVISAVINDITIPRTIREETHQLKYGDPPIRNCLYLLSLDDPYYGLAVLSYGELGQTREQAESSFRTRLMLLIA